MSQTLLAPASVLICWHSHLLSNPVNGCRAWQPVTRYQVIDQVTNWMVINPDTWDVYFYTDWWSHASFVEWPCIAVDFCSNVIACVNAALVDPSGNWLWNLTEAVQDAIWDAIAWFDYADALNGWIQENPLTSAVFVSYDNTTSWLTATNVQAAIDELNSNIWNIKHTIQASNGAVTLNPDDIINITVDSSVSVVTVDETVPTVINVKIPATAPYVKAVEIPTPNTRTPIIHNLNTPVPWLYAYDSSGEYIDIEWKYIDTNTVEYRTTTSDSFTYYIKS